MGQPDVPCKQESLQSCNTCLSFNSKKLPAAQQGKAFIILSNGFPMSNILLLPVQEQHCDSAHPLGGHWGSQLCSADSSKILCMEGELHLLLSSRCEGSSCNGATCAHVLLWWSEENREWVRKGRCLVSIPPPHCGCWCSVALRDVVQMNYCLLSALGERECCSCKATPFSGKLDETFC